MKIYDKSNFHKHTFCVFKEVSISEVEDLKRNYTSKSGSEYFFTKEGIYRKSNHWGRAANCKWRLQTNSSEISRMKIGFAKWTDFHSINETEKLYYIKVDFDKKSVLYNHKATSQDENIYLRNAYETAKRIKEIRNLFENNKKLHYWESKLTTNELLEKVVTYLVKTDLNLLQIKQELQLKIL